MKEIVIKIPDEVENRLAFGVTYKDDIRTLLEAMANGKVLPKGHDRLIDAKAYENDIRKHYFDNDTVIRCTEIALSCAKALVEADKESEA